MLLIYCNCCFDTKEETNHGFVITNCYHVFCDGCVKSIVKDFCILCKAECKMLPINKELPQEVKEYFDYGSIERHIDTIEKISQFFENQNKMYVDKNAGCRKTYQKYKKSILEMNEQRKALDRAIWREEAYMKRLKVAIETNIITTDLFELPSPEVSNKLISSDFNEDQAGSSDSAKRINKLPRLPAISNRNKPYNQVSKQSVVKEQSNSSDERKQAGSSESSVRIKKLHRSPAIGNSDEDLIISESGVQQRNKSNKRLSPANSNKPTDNSSITTKPMSPAWKQPPNFPVMGQMTFNTTSGTNGLQAPSTSGSSNCNYWTDYWSGK